MSSRPTSSATARSRSRSSARSRGSASAEAATLTLPAALAQALAGINGEAPGHGDDGEAAPATGALLVVTAGPLGRDRRASERVAHAAAVAGVPLSVVALGGTVPLDEAQRLALAGQGALRVMTAPSEAPAIAEAELHAASRIVARALRLKVRLAPGVKLVSVLGSRRLDRVEARRVRAAEKAEDQRLAKALGIASDRDKDEDSIRIAIPAFYADDVHAVLLDVVVERPGPVADVTLKYKDLVELGNHTVTAGLALESGQVAAGPLEARVVKNALALELAQRLERAAGRLQARDAAGAAAELAAARALAAGLPLELPALRGDADLRADAAWLGRYQQVLSAGAVQQPQASVLLADVLRLAAFLRTSAAPRSN